MPNIPHSGTINANIKSPIVVSDGSNQVLVKDRKSIKLLEDIQIVLNEILKQLREGN